MKSKLALFILASASVINNNYASAQLPTYLLKITNEVQVNPTTFEFDVFLLSNDSAFELAVINFGIGIDTSVKNGGSLTASLIMGSSELPAWQTPPNVGMGIINSTSTTGHCGSCNGTGIIYNYMNVAPSSIPLPGTGAIVSNIDSGCVHPGTRIGRFKIRNSVAFAAGSKLNMVWSASASFGRTNTILNAFMGTIATPIVNAGSNLNWNSPGTCAINPVLNPITIGVTENDQLSSIQLYPNPATNAFTLHLAASSEFEELQLVDMSGRVVVNKLISSDHLFDTDVSFLKPGLYTLRLSGISGTVNKKLSIVK